MKTNHRIIIGDSRRMDSVTDGSVHLVVTSPPYWQLKDYGTKEQIGFNDSYEDYINNLNLVWKECHRVLENGCRLCINIGDQFARSVYYGRYKVIPIRTEITKFCEIIGFDFMGSIIWQKVTTTNTSGGASIMGSFPYPRNGILKLNYEFILIFKKTGDSVKVEGERKQQSKLTTEEWNTYFSGHWNFPGERQNKHLAMFPNELPRRLIKMFTFVGDTVLDPFLGSGTTSLSASHLGRNSVGFEINEEFIPVITQKLGIDQDLFGDAKFVIETQPAASVDFSSAIQQLPYVFNDHVKMDKKIDPKERLFGSKIDKHSKPDKDYFSVKNIIAPNLLELNDRVIIKLLGIKIKTETCEQAIEFLKAKTKGEKVFLKYDKKAYDNDNNRLCYVYLKNKTFLNAHLIKNGLAEADTDMDYKYQNKFLQYQKDFHV